MKYVRRSGFLSWAISLLASTAVAAACAMAVMATTGPEDPCVVEKVATGMNEEAAIAECDAEAAALAAASEPEAEPEVVPAADPATEVVVEEAVPAEEPGVPAENSAPVVDPAADGGTPPATPAAGEQPAAPAPPVAATPRPKSAPAGGKKRESALPTAAPRKRVVAEGVKAVKQVEQEERIQAAEEAQSVPERHVNAAAEFVDARTFRENFKAKARIPEIANLSTETADLLTAAQSATDVSWSLVAAVAWLDTRWGDPAAGAFVGTRLQDGQWNRYGTDGDADGEVDRASEADQIATFATFVADVREANDDKTRAALHEYFDGKRQRKLVKRAMFLAAYYDALGTVAITEGLDSDKTRDELIGRLIADARVTIYEGGRQDVISGLIDVRLMVLLEFLANRYGSVTVSSLVSGHSVFTSSGNVSLHSYGQAVDIAALGEESILGNQQKGSRTHRALRDILLMSKSLQPAELISLWDLGGPSFALGDHHDHIHVGFE